MSGTRADQVFCRYYMSGACRKGDQCQFSHNRNDRPSTICRYYQRGQCTYGAGCRFDHVRCDSTSTNNERSPNGSGNSPGGVPSSSAKLKVAAEADVSPGKSPPGGARTRATKLRVEAAEFVPGSSRIIKSNRPLSYSHAVAGDRAEAEGTAPCAEEHRAAADLAKELLCPYSLLGHCWYGDQCSFLHGDKCDLCDQPVLHPTDKEHNAKHRRECMAEHERAMESAFAQVKSREKQCGICMEIVMEKSDATKRRFGLLPNCKHCFCLDCIRQWRRAKSFENKIIRACPECRTLSDYVVPSSVWADEEAEKFSLIDGYRTSMKSKTCKYFDRTNSSTNPASEECPFGNKCFYKHLDAQGREVSGDSPKAVRRRQRERHSRHSRGRGAGPAGALGASTTDLFALWGYVTVRNSAGGGGSEDGGVGRSRRSSSNGIDDWLWDELEYELHLLDTNDDGSNYDMDAYEDSDWSDLIDRS